MSTESYFRQLLARACDAEANQMRDEAEGLLNDAIADAAKRNCVDDLSLGYKTLAEFSQRLGRLKEFETFLRLSRTISNGCLRAGTDVLEAFSAVEDE